MTLRSQPRMSLSWPQATLELSALIGALNAARQALFATAPISDWLAAFSGLQAIMAALALWLLVRRHPRAALALLAWGITLVLAVVLGTELLLGNTVSLSQRLPGYLVATALAVGTVIGGTRELRRFEGRSGAAAAERIAKPTRFRIPFTRRP